MLPEIQEISRRRRQLGIKQKDLAGMAEVSQSFIAKLESGKINPSYQKVKAILESFERLEHENSIKAKDIMNRKLIFVNRSDKISEVVKKMRNNSISQLPVFSGDAVVGTISEKTIVDQMAGAKNIKDILKLPVSDILDEAFPQISDSTPITVITTLLRFNQAVLITKRGKAAGIITKSDLLKI